MYPWGRIMKLLRSLWECRRNDINPAKAKKLDILVSPCSLIMGKYMITILTFEIFKVT